MITSVFNKLLGKNNKKLGEVKFSGTIGHLVAKNLARDVGKIINSDMKVPFCFAGIASSKSCVCYSLAEDKTTYKGAYMPVSFNKRVSDKAKPVECLFIADENITSKDIKTALKQAKQIARVMDWDFSSGEKENSVTFLLKGISVEINGNTNLSSLAKRITKNEISLQVVKNSINLTQY